MFNIWNTFKQKCQKYRLYIIRSVKILDKMLDKAGIDTGCKLLIVAILCYSIGVAMGLSLKV